MLARRIANKSKLGVRCQIQHCCLSTSLPRHQPRINPRSTSLKQSSNLNFGQYNRIVPRSLAVSKPMPSESSYDKVPAHIVRPPYAKSGSPPSWETQIPILLDHEIEHMREASAIARDALQLGGGMVRPGVTTAAIDEAIHQFIVGQNAYPSCLNYMGFPKSVCTSINNVIAHGIPDSRELRDGDMINIDVTVYKNGFHGDTSATFRAGMVDEVGEQLIQATKESLELAIQMCGPGVPFCRIGESISSLAEPHGYSVSTDLTGHGIGRNFHQNPLIYHHVNDEPGEMAEGMAFTIEPILCQGVAAGIQWPDGWTISTEDGGRSAQFEHTVVITSNGVAILT
ncbi:hypothetical protein EV183_000235 [Coemansia sp. RSA 2336]|nr:hypothetical protein EV183_000235 [Coemansia sp. RSA 2336]